MDNDLDLREPMLEMFIFETTQLLEQLEEILLNVEKRHKFSKDGVNEIFRIMHTIKGSAAMMMYTGIASLAHALEDLFQFIRESPKAPNSDDICEFSLKAADLIKSKIAEIESGEDGQEMEKDLENKIREYLSIIKDSTDNKSEDLDTTKIPTTTKRADLNSFGLDEFSSSNRFICKIFFEEGCQMENVRAYAIIHSIERKCKEVFHRPAKIFDDENSLEEIIQNGFEIYITTDMEEDEIRKILEESIFVDKYTITKVDDYTQHIMDLIDFNSGDQIIKNSETNKIKEPDAEGEENHNGTGGGISSQKSNKQNIISVNVSKLDKLMDLVGEIVITESMVTGNKELQKLKIESFNKSARQLRKLTDELQDIVMSVRMVPVASTFHKMNRIVRDMCKSLNKEVQLEIEGEDTEVDKNIIDNLSDPLMHLIRNSMDHGIESPEERKKAGKPEVATIRLEAQNSGGDVTIMVSDDGKGLDRESILRKGKEKGLLTKPENELTDREVFAMILLPGFSTKEKITEYSGRGVGMDVVTKNIEKLGGNVAIESTFGKGTCITIRIPLTLAIVDGMEVSVGDSVYTIPTISIKESFKAEKKNILHDTDGNEMIMIRGTCYPIVRIHQLFGGVPKTTELTEGIMICVEEKEKQVVLFADKLLGEQQVVVKPLPTYFSKYGVKKSGIGGCTILGDGNISLILDVIGTIERVIKS